MTRQRFDPDEAGVIYHALNRGNDRNKIFKKPADYEAFERILRGTAEVSGGTVFVHAHTQSLAFGIATGQRSTDGTFFAVGLGDTHAAISRALPSARLRSPVPISIEERSDPGRQPFQRCLPLSGAEPSGRESGVFCWRLALRFALSVEPAH